MPTECIPYSETGYFSPLMCDYLAEKSTLTPFYNRFPKLENFEAQIQEKQQSSLTDVSQRTVLVKALQEQYSNVNASEATLENIQKLASENSFTITTGHQLNLFTGPLYFLYKIISTINLATTLKEKHPNYEFVPIYWMASEDHDFDEICYFNYKGKKVRWNREASGAVGELSTEGLQDVFEVFSKELGNSNNAKQLQSLFKEGYLKHDNLTAATRYIANELFKIYGLVIVDGNDKALKQLFIPFVENELFQQTAHKKVLETAHKLTEVNDSYKIQVNPREINLFYITEGIRERIIEKNGVFTVNNTSVRWNSEQIQQEVHEFPARFSPNALLRPLYQEIILPNLCYIGGGGELAYWLELKSYFEAVNVTFPMILLRNSVVVKTEKQSEKMVKLNITNRDLFLKRDAFVNKKVKELSDIEIDFTSQKEHLQQQFKDLYKIAEQTDQSFIGAVAAQEKKQLKGLQHLEKRLLKAQKRGLKDKVSRSTDLQEILFPGNSLQERRQNFSELYLEHGENLIPTLVEHLQPLSGEFLVLEL
ncbi:bacillithiol biosynthesis cysteine-adding enzyme BshC [Kordia sp. YSTF-M3]|uniref:Putative cysteine ligase BshC n=1 Tax=Kordia aestuariivivens TaxID=2759037 RepID=A0ABR7QFY6_9FLAO|nr:bacillithiol biosynthesis cysteine-adding enzyme BshC [Kordia aestuariivivens]MBC8757482.1 bacillithiol biosynthesis cysteine-adding enzyme BshC [Kordia aestuariivivens]